MRGEMNAFGPVPETQAAGLTIGLTTREAAHGGNRTPKEGPWQRVGGGRGRHAISGTSPLPRLGRPTIQA